jgi:hypothetical protein
MIVKRRRAEALRLGQMWLRQKRRPGVGSAMKVGPAVLPGVGPHACSCAELEGCISWPVRSPSNVRLLGQTRRHYDRLLRKRIEHVFVELPGTSAANRTLPGPVE